MESKLMIYLKCIFAFIAIGPLAADILLYPILILSSSKPSEFSIISWLIMAVLGAIPTYLMGARSALMAGLLYALVVIVAFKGKQQSAVIRMTTGAIIGAIASVIGYVIHAKEPMATYEIGALFLLIGAFSGSIVALLLRQRMHDCVFKLAR